MAIDFSVESEFQDQLDWIRDLVHSEIEPLDLAFGGEEGALYDKSHPVHEAVLRPLQDRVRARGLWACHLGPDLGGQGYGQAKLALMNEILGRSIWAPSAFGCQAPDSGNAEILAHYGTEEQKTTYLQPLLDGRISSCFSMTEPDGGSDPQQFACRAVRDGDDWVINGEKWFSSSLRHAAFAIVMAVTDPDVPVYHGASMFLVPTDTPGVNILRHTGLAFDKDGMGNHAYVRYEDVRVPAENLLGGEGQAFHVSQTRLGGGRLHHAMRTVGAVARCLDMMCERALSRVTQGEPLARKQMVQDMIAETWIALQQFRLQVLHAAWVVDQVGGHAARTEIAAVKVATPKLYRDAVMRTMQIHGSLGLSNEMPLGRMLLAALSLGLADGPTEVHKVTVARQVLKQYKAVEGPWPSEHLPIRRAEARARFADALGETH
jgi:acyl-CoA dehydrogenase